MKTFKDMLTVRIGRAKTNEEALAGSDYEHLAGLSGSEIDEAIIKDVYAQEMSYYKDDLEGQKTAKENYKRNQHLIRKE